jgi:hypothetical protein
MNGSRPILDELHERLANLVLHIPRIEEWNALQADSVFLQFRELISVLVDALRILALLCRGV